MDNVIESVGSFGKFQYKVIVLIGLISALSSALLYATIFIAAEPTLICTKEPINQTNLNHINRLVLGQNLSPQYQDNKTILISNMTHYEKSYMELHHPDDSTQHLSKDESDECKIWAHIMSSKASYNVTSIRKMKKIAHEGFIIECHFDKTYYDRTIINEWDLMCDRSYKASLTQTVHIFGSIFGFCGGRFSSFSSSKISFFVNQIINHLIPN
jgi:hypothetical protein